MYKNISQNFFSRCANAEVTMDLIFTAFNSALPAWCLYFIEKVQYDEVIIFLYLNYPLLFNFKILFYFQIFTQYYLVKFCKMEL